MYFRSTHLLAAAVAGAAVGVLAGWLLHVQIARPDDELLQLLDDTRGEYESQLERLEAEASSRGREAEAALQAAGERLGAFEDLQSAYVPPAPEPPPVRLKDVPLTGLGVDVRLAALEDENRRLRDWGAGLQSALRNREDAVRVLREAVDRLQRGTDALMDQMDAERSRADLAESRVRQYQRVRWTEYTYFGPCVFAGRGSLTAGWELEDSQSQSFGVGAGVCLGVNVLGIFG